MMGHQPVRNKDASDILASSVVKELTKIKADNMQKKIDEKD